MSLSDDKQRIMPTQKDRENSKALAYPEAVLLTNATNPEIRGEVPSKSISKLDFLLFLFMQQLGDDIF